jgi:hypothetical protein
MAKAGVGYSKEARLIQITVPHGTKSTELSAVLKSVLVPGVIGRLPRGCQTCTSGDHVVIREELAETIQVEI